MNIVVLREAKGSLDAVGKRLEEAVKARKFGVIAILDLQAKMREKGVDFARPCRIYEVCNPQKAKQVLESDMRISTALPCRISLYEEGGKTMLATLLPTETLGLFGAPGLEAVAQEVEREITAMMDAAAG
tara:strand:+ start:31 stop:420 length:390 start_codon:yes stop_codon:yes gene_type:complete